VVATPLLLLLLLGIVQFALWQHATHIAQAAAEQGLSAARVQGGTAATGHTDAEQVLTQIGAGVLTGPTVTSAITGGQVRVVVAGHAEPVLPFLHLAVRATATGPVEAFYPDGTTP
jgi:Flp pilus assembly protein TadG